MNNQSGTLDRELELLGRQVLARLHYEFELVKTEQAARGSNVTAYGIRSRVLTKSIPAGGKRTKATDRSAE